MVIFLLVEMKMINAVLSVCKETKSGSNLFYFVRIVCNL